MSHESEKGIGIKSWISGQKPQPKAEGRTKTDILDKSRIAVLPFSNISPDDKDAYFADGMTEELIATLSSISGLRVIARTSVMRYKSTNKGVGEIGQELRVGTILEGSVRKFENRLRATVQLIDASSEEHLWAESYDRDLRDVFSIQSEIARKVADALRVKMLRGEAERVEKIPTSSIDAYTLYLRGRAFWNERTEQGLRSAVGYFERAIAADPKYAPAYAGLADACVILVDYGYQDSKEGLIKAKSNALKALELDATLAEAHVSLAGVFWNELDSEGAGRELNKAIQLNPSYATARHWYTTYLIATGRLEEAISEARRAKELDPFSPIISLMLGATLITARQYDKAIEALRKELTIFPDYWNLHDHLGTALIGDLKYDEGIFELKKAVALSNNSVGARSDLAVGYALSSKREEAVAILDELVKLPASQYVSPLRFAAIHASLDNNDEAFKWLERAYQERSGGLLETLLVDPQIRDKLGTDARFQALLRKVGL